MHRRIMKDEYGPATNWYRCAMQDLNLKDEEEAKLDPKLEGPVLMIVAKGDPLSNVIAINAMKDNVESLKIVEFNSGHWVQIEKREEVNATLEEFFKGLEKKV
jgi:soluble epoxide hydrolase / lipid-phosphate phosphatase